MKKLLLSMLCAFLISGCGGITPVPVLTFTPTIATTDLPTAANPAAVFPTTIEIAITHPELEIITPENVQQIELVDRWGKGNIYGVEISPDGSQIAVGTSTGVYLYDRFTSKQIGLLDLPIAAEVKSGECNLQEDNLSFSPDGRFLAVADTDVKIWDLGASKLHKIITNPIKEPVSIITEIKFSPDGGRIATLQKEKYANYPCYVAWRSFLIYDANSGNQIFRHDFIGSDEFPSEFQFGSDNSIYLYVDSVQGGGREILKVDLSDGAILAENVLDIQQYINLSDSALVYSQFFPDSGKVTSHFIDLESGREIKTIPDWAAGVSDFPYVFIGEGNFILETLEGKRVCSFSKEEMVHPYTIRSLTHDKKMGISWEHNTAEVRLWDFEKCTVSKPILYLHEFARKMKFSPDGKSLVANSSSGYGYYILDTQSGDVRYTVEPWDIYKVYDVDFSAGGKKIAVYNQDAIVEYDAITGVKKGTLFVLQRGFLGGRFEFNPNGSTVIYSDRGMDILRGTMLGEVIRNSLHGYFRFSDDGSTLITFSVTENGTEVSLLNLFTGETAKGKGLIPSAYPGTMVVDHGISHLAALDRRTISLWKLPAVDLQKSLVLTGSDTQWLVGPIIFSRDDGLIITAAHDPSEILFWDVETSQVVHRIPVSETNLELGYHIGMSPDGRLLATLGNDGTIHVWGVKK